MAETAQGALVLVLTTEASLEKAERLAATLLEKGLVVCVSLFPIVSHYRWEGRIQRSEEVQLLLKSHPPRLEALHELVMELHSYDTPEWITLAAETRGAYGRWCAEQLEGAPFIPGDGPPDRSANPGDGAPAG